MDELAEKKEPETVNGTDQPERRVVSRRLVQSTLYPLKSPEIQPKVEQKGKGGEVDNSDDDDEEFYFSQGNKKGRKRKSKVSPQNRASKKQAKEKSPRKTTPKKSGMKGKSPRKTTPKKNGMNKLTESEDASPPAIPNLRMEAKLSAEQYSRMFEGRKVHPFFASVKAGKRSLETGEREKNGCLFVSSNQSISIGPIHVFERNQDDLVLDWQCWTFIEKNPNDSSCNLEGQFTSVFESCVGALCLDNFPSFSHFSDASFAQNKFPDKCIIQGDSLGTSLPIPAVLIDDQFESCKLLKSSERDGQAVEVDFQANNVENLEFEQQSIELGERVLPSYHGCGIQPVNSLWSDKYQPKSSTEVCGNSEAVKFMSEWLRLWLERNFQANKPSNNTCISNKGEDDEGFSGSDFDSENIDGEDSLKNVLFVTGPVGSGKSAAIRACAKEQGFIILESNASDCRSGAILKQNYAEALKSHCITRSLENPVDSPCKHVTKSAGRLSKDETMQEFDNEIIELISTSEEEDSFGVINGAFEKHICNDSEIDFGQSKVKSLILFEEVDITFPEDRGFIAAIRKIAEEAKGPVILTSNSSNLVLPDNLDRLELCFSVPSQEELLHYLYMICAAEKATIQPHLLAQLIKIFQGDIRKTIMHLQFWCQSKQYQKDGKLQKSDGLQLFDIETGHSVLPTIIPWEFPSQLSEFVEREIDKTLSMMEGNSTLMEVVEKDLENNNMPNGLGMHDNGIDRIEAKKEVILSRNVHECDEFITPSTSYDFYNSSGTPVTFSRRTRKLKLDVVMSSDSEDEGFKQPLVSDKNVNRELFFEEDCSLLPHCPNMQNSARLLTGEESGFQCSETENYLQTETCNTMDVVYVPQTKIVNSIELSSRTFSCDNVGETEVSVSCDFTEDLFPVQANHPGKTLHKLVKTSDIFRGTHNITAEASNEEVVENSQNEYDEAVMDEFGHMNFIKRSFSMRKLKNHVTADLVQESWKKLRDRHADLKFFVDLEPKDALKILNLSSRMSDLISQADQFYSKCQMQDSLELLMVPSEKSDVFFWHDEYMQMANIISEHGFCLYGKEIDAIGSHMGFEHRVNLSQEMLASSTNTMVLGRLLASDARASSTSVDRKGLNLSPSQQEQEVKRDDVKSCLSNIIRSIVPSRLYLASKGAAFHEYISSLGCISRSEASRLSAVMGLTKRRRTRGARHYLSSGALMLSPEDISFLSRYNFSGNLSITDSSFRKS